MKFWFSNKAISYGSIVLVSVIGIGVGSLFVSSRTDAVSEASAVETTERLVTIYDRRQQKVILTEATTVREALKDAEITLDPRDTVEPELSKKLVATSYFINIYRARPVLVVDGSLRQKIMTPHQTAESIAADAGLELHDEDRAEFEAISNVTHDGVGEVMTIDRATPFTLVLYGKRSQAYTQAETVSEMLGIKKITLASNDTLSVSKNASVTAGMTVEIWRNGKQTVTEEKPVPFETEQVKDADREVGFREVKTPGVEGKRMVTFEIEMRNGAEIARREIQSVVLEQPKKQVEVVGAKVKNFGGSCSDWMAAAGINDMANATYLIGKESGCNPYAVNKSSGACGVGQALPCSKTGCEMGDGACQTKWMNSYVMSRYGSWQAAADHHRRKGWY